MLFVSYLCNNDEYCHGGFLSLQSIKDKKLSSRVPGNGNSTSAFSSVEPNMDEHEAGFPDGYPFPTSDNQDTDFAYHGTALSVEEKKEFLVITRNSVDILSSMLNAETDKKPVKVCLNI